VVFVSNKIFTNWHIVPVCNITIKSSNLLLWTGWWTYRFLFLSKHCPDPAVLTPLSRPGFPDPAVLARLFWPGCPDPDVLTQMSWPGCPDPDVLTRMSWPWCPDQAVLTGLSWPGCPDPAVLTQLSWPNCPNPAVLTRLGCPDTAGLSWPGCPDTADLSRLSCLVYPVLAFLSRSSFAGCINPAPVHDVLSWISYPSCLVQVSCPVEESLVMGCCCFSIITYQASLPWMHSCRVQKSKKTDKKGSSVKVSSEENEMKDGQTHIPSLFNYHCP
jgi:hypothetical protein